MGDTENDRADATVELKWDMKLPYPGGGNGRGGSTEGGYLWHKPPEHCRIINRNKAHFILVSGGSATPRSMGLEVVLGRGGT